jgi:glutathione S-transferase
MLTIWGRHNSNNVKKALWCAEELGLDYEHIPAGGAFGMVNDAAYRALNPNGLVPTLRDGDFILWESNAIVRYLAAKHPEGGLYPEDPAKRAIGDRWMDWATSTLAPTVGPLTLGWVRTKPENRDLAALEATRQRCAAALAIVDAALAETPYLSGETFGMGDIPMGPFAYTWFGLPIERPELPNLAAWYQRLTARPAYQKAVMIPLS